MKGPALLFSSAILLSGCADYMSHRDTVTLGVGNAMAANVAIHTVNPFPPDAHTTTIEGNGRRVAGAMGVYYGTGKSGGGYTGPCAVSSDRASDGSICGERAASERPGGSDGVR